MTFSKEFETLKSLVDNSLNEMLLSYKDGIPEKLYKSMEYSLLNGGKRIRPVLFLAVLSTFDKEFDENCIKFACAIEVLHTYTLIHDDLPCMDDDDYRRGKLTNHKVFGEGVAVLAGDALLNLAYELIFESCKGGSLYVEAGKYFSSKVGGRGLIAGQIIDIEKISDVTERSNRINYIYQHKTCDLIKSAIVCGGIISGANDKELDILNKFGDTFGYSFQLQDDILDADKEKGTDSNSMINVYDMQYTKNMLKQVTETAISLINELDKNVSFFIKLTCKLAGRKE